MCYWQMFLLMDTRLNYPNSIRPKEEDRFLLRHYLPDRQLKILATGQFIRWSFATLAGFFQAFLLNGPTTNTDDCSISWQQCWSWGLTVREYYGLLTLCISLLFIPMCFLKESDPRLVPAHTAQEFLSKIWVRLLSFLHFFP